MRFFKRLWVEASSLFEADKHEEEEINLNRLAIIFLLGLLLLFGSYFLFFDESNTIYNSVTFMYESVHEFVYNTARAILDMPKNIYHSINLYLQNLAISEPRRVADGYEVIGCKTCKIEAKIEQDSNTWIIDYELSHKGYLWHQMHKIVERIFGVPVDFGWVQIRKDLSSADWSEYKSISLSIKGEGNPSNLEFSVIEEEGDAWYYLDKNSLTSTDWTEIRIPFKDFTNPSWASHGDGRKDFKNVIKIGLTFTNFEEPVKNKLYFEMFDGELFKLT